MLTVGVDLAAEPKKTAMAPIDWSPSNATVVGLQVGVRDEPIVDAAADCVKVGIDCPLGWPVPFVQFISSHHDGHVVVPAGVEGLVWRRQLAFRTTDAAVRELTGLRLIPLSVAADRIGHTVMRCAALGSCWPPWRCVGCRSTGPAPAWSWRSTRRRPCGAGSCPPRLQRPRQRCHPPPPRRGAAT